MIRGSLNMLLLRIASVFILTCSCLSVDGKRQQTKPGCRYEGRRYQEGMAVNTPEPCLQCRCIEGSLRCRLRVCPRFPSPLPPGCRTQSPREHVCCAELVCGESPDTETILGRSNTDDTSGNDGCLYEGIRYGPGSAMMGSRRCEYCYCISGVRRCVRPKCLLPLPGCTPLYVPHSCCPVAYNCTHSHSTTIAPLSINGCRVGDRAYEEGEMVRNVMWKATCDNCFCAMGAVRCVPLACAPPLQGCSPIVREGQCCPSTYNCSGSIQVKATQNYASYAFISKDYAKFRKETNFFEVHESMPSRVIEGRGHQIVNAGSESSTMDMEDSTMTEVTPTVPRDFQTEIMDNEILMETTDYLVSTTQEINTPATDTPTEEFVTTGDPTVWDSSTGETDTKVPSSTDSALLSTFTDDSPTTDAISTGAETTASTVTDLEETHETTVTQREETDTKKIFNGTTPSSSTTSAPKSTLLLSREPGNKEDVETTHVEKLSDGGGLVSDVDVSDTGKPTTILMPNDLLITNVTVKTNVSMQHIQGLTIKPIILVPPDIEILLNISHRGKGEDYDYDYSEPTLPPSLPNVRIIPFVAADALVKNDKDISAAVTDYPTGSVGIPAELHATDTSGSYVTQKNRFSPPVETEGGFVPREPPYFDTSYHSTDLNLEVGTSVTILPEPMMNPHRKDSDLHMKCLFKGRGYRHAEIVPSSQLCIACICYYGEIVCSTEKCPPLKIGCRRVNHEQECCGKIICVEAEESPTVVLDREESLHRSTVSPDPFRDVIKTEPAPDLSSLIEDMIPYLVEHIGASTSRPTTPMTTSAEGNSTGDLLLLNQLNVFPANESLRIREKPDDFQKVDSRLKGNLTKNLESGTANLINGTAAVTPDPSKDFSPNATVINYLLKPVNSSSANSSSVVEAQSESEEGSVFSFENVFDLLFSDVTGTRINDGEATMSAAVETTNGMVLSGGDSSTGNSNGNNSYSSSGDNSDRNSNSGSNNSNSTSDNNNNNRNSSSGSSNNSISFNNNNNNNKTDISDSSNSSDNSSINRESNNSSSSSSSGNGDSISSISTEESSAVIPQSLKILENEIPAALTSQLKVAGCNIYGRMYRVGRIITELSGRCRECRCTEVGVQCKQLC